MALTKTSAGLLLFRRRAHGLEVLLVHPGGPYWVRKDLGAWSIPKGEVEAGEDLETAALREFREETGLSVTGPILSLGSLRQAGGKIVHGFACEGDCDPAHVRSNLFEMEWPPRSGQVGSFPEIDRAEWFSLAVAREKVNKAQSGFLDLLGRLLADEQ